MASDHGGTPAAHESVDDPGEPGTTPQPLSTRPRRRRRAVWAAVLVAAVVAGAGLAGTLRGQSAVGPGGSFGATAGPSPTAATPGPSDSAGPNGSTGSPRPGRGDRGYLTSLAELTARAEAAANGREPDRAAVDDLLAWAASAAASRAHPVQRLRIDGDESPFVDDSATAYGLALAYGVTGDRAYAEASRRFIMAWVETMGEALNACSDSGACQTSLIISRAAPGFVFAADLIGPSGVLTADDASAFQRWLRKVILPTASELTNNWGDAGTFTRVVLTDYLGDQAGFAAALDKWRTQIDLIEADGHIPAEVARGRAGMGYTQEALDYKVAVARIAERRGIDLWTYVGTRGGSFRGAIDYLAGFWGRPDEWPWNRRVQLPVTGPFWEIAYARWPTPSYEPIIERRRPFGFQGHSALRWTTLTSGVSFLDQP